MGKTLKYLFGVSALIIGVSVTVFLIFTYWEKILAYTTAGARVASNILGTLTGSSKEREDPSGYYDI